MDEYNNNQNQQNTYYQPDFSAPQQNNQPPQYEYNYQQPQYTPVDGRLPSGSKEKLVAGLLAILLGSLGIHKFYLGYNKSGVIMLLVSIFGSILTFGLAAGIMEIIGVIEGVMYLVKTDEEFDRTYVTGTKEWF